MSDSNEIRSPEVDDLLSVLARMDDEDEIYSLLEDLFTIREIRETSQRLSVAQFLDQGQSYSSIVAKTGASATTIARVSKCLGHGSGGYRLALDILNASERHSNNTNMRQAKFKNFIFDLDGTLLDTLPDLVLLTNGILSELNFPERTQDEILSFVGQGVRSLMNKALPNDISAEMEDRAMDLWNEKFYEYYHHTFPYAGIIETLDQLKVHNCNLGIVSNKLQSGVDLIIDKCLAGYFQVALGDSPSCPRKPDPTGLNIAMQTMKAVLAETVYIGDSPSDIVAAHNANLFAVAVLWGYHKKEDFPTEGDAKPDMFIEKPEDLLKLTQ